jgi:hypothetical protein
MEATIKEEVFDEELCGMVKFEDETKAEHTEKTMAAENKKADAKPKKKRNEPIDAEYEPVANSWLDSPEIKCIKWFVFFAGIEYIVFYWFQTGQMELSAAMPSMIACALLAGIGVGKNWRWKI